MEGVSAFFEKREPVVEGPVSPTAEQPDDGQSGVEQAPTQADGMRELVEDLQARRAQAIGWAAARRRSQRQHAAEKLTARERIALLVDEGTFSELGIHGRPHFAQPAMEGVEAPADGVSRATARSTGGWRAWPRTTSR